MANDVSGLMPLIGAFVGIFLVVFIIIYVYIALALMTIAKKTNTSNPWLAWIPIANIYLMTQIAKLPWWYTLAIFLPIIPIIGSLALAVIMVYFWWKIAEARNKPGWYGILTIIPIVNFIMIGIIAWSD